MEMIISLYYIFIIIFCQRMQAEELHVVKCYWCSSYGASFRDILIRKVTLNTVVDNNPTHRRRSFCVMVNNFIIHYHAVNSLRRKVYTLLMLLASYPL